VRDTTGHVVKSKIYMSGDKVFSSTHPVLLPVLRRRPPARTTAPRRSIAARRRNGRSANPYKGKSCSPVFGWTQSCTFGQRYKSWLAPLWSSAMSCKKFKKALSLRACS
jgi:hypothetical protein